MVSGFTLRLSILGASLAALGLAWHWLRPSRTHVFCALPAAAVGAFADWWVEALLFRAGVWEHVGGRPWLTLLGVPLEMPAAFVPAGMAGLWLISVGTYLPTRLPPARVAAIAYAGWCLVGVLADALNLSTGAGVHSAHPFGEIIFLYVAPFWVLVSAIPPFFYWLALQVVAPRLSVFDVRAARARG